MTLEIDPPLLKRTTSYEQWKLEIKAWTVITEISREKQAITVALFLPEDHESRIKEKVFEHFQPEELQKESGISTLLDFLDKHLQKDELADTLEKFEDFENFKRKEGQSMHEYVSIFDFKYKKIEKKQIKFLPEILAFRLLQRANISRQERLIILTGINTETKATMYEEAKTILKRFTGCKGAISWGSLCTEESKYKYNTTEYVRVQSGHQPIGGEMTRTWRFERNTGRYAEAGKDHKIKSDSESVVNKTGLKKKINPSGRDGEVLKCKSCGSFRHLLDDCPDSWENMGKKVDKENTEKSQSHGDLRKIVKNGVGPFEYGGGKQLELQGETNIEAVMAKLTQEIENLKKENKILRDDIKELQLGNEGQTNAQAKYEEKMGGKEIVDVKKEIGTSLESTIRGLNQTLISIEKNELFLVSNLKRWAAEMEKGVSVLNAQHESLFKKHKELERLLLSVEKVKTPSIKEKKLKIEELLDDHQNELRPKNTEKWSIIWGKLENQIEGIEAMEENIERNQSGWGIREEDSGVAGMRLSTRALVEGKERQKMHWKLRQLQEIQDSDEIKSCSKQRLLSNSGTNVSVLANQILKLLYCDLKLYL